MCIFYNFYYFLVPSVILCYIVSKFFYTTKFIKEFGNIHAFFSI